MIPLTTKRVLRKQGGDKISGKEIFSADLTGVETLVNTKTNLVKGEKYIVDLDGTTYETKCNVIDVFTYIGNLSLFDGSNDTGEPFVVLAANMDGTDATMTIVNNGASHITIKTAETIVPIDPKFLPGVTIDLSEYGFDPLSLFMSGGGSQTVENADGLWQKINDADGYVNFSANLGDLVVMTPVVKNRNAEHGWWMFGFTLITVNGGAIVKADVVLYYASGGAALAMKLA